MKKIFFGIQLFIFNFAHYTDTLYAKIIFHLLCISSVFKKDPFMSTALEQLCAQTFARLCKLHPLKLKVQSFC